MSGINELIFEQVQDYIRDLNLREIPKIESGEISESMRKIKEQLVMDGSLSSESFDFSSGSSDDDVYHDKDLKSKSNSDSYVSVSSKTFDFSSDSCSDDVYRGKDVTSKSGSDLYVSVSSKPVAVSLDIFPNPIYFSESDMSFVSARDTFNKLNAIPPVDYSGICSEEDLKGTFIGDIREVQKQAKILEENSDGYVSYDCGIIQGMAGNVGIISIESTESHSGGLDQKFKRTYLITKIGQKPECISEKF